MKCSYILFNKRSYHKFCKGGNLSVLDTVNMNETHDKLIAQVSTTDLLRPKNYNLGPKLSIKTSFSIGNLLRFGFFMTLLKT